MKDFSPHIFRIQRYSLHDGPGIRTTLFFQGCPLACAWCHNPESQALPEGGGLAGAEIPDLVRNLVLEIEKDLIYYDESGGGVTFSGGEPLCRADLLMPLLLACRERQIHTCLDTSGYAPFEILEPAARAADLVLYDIKVADDKAHQRLTGKPLGPVLDNLAKLSGLGIDLKLRFPLIPSMTDDAENIDGILSFLSQRTEFRRIHILPFHNTGAGKYRALGRPDPAAHVRVPDPSRVEDVAQRFCRRGFDTTIGG